MSCLEPLLSDHDLERITGRARSCWQKDRVNGSGPNYIRVGRLIRYRANEVSDWLSSRTYSSTSQVK
jgi:predicted DNA-binding transcriptional regulator AlpA